MHIMISPSDLCRQNKNAKYLLLNVRFAWQILETKRISRPLKKKMERKVGGGREKKKKEKKIREKGRLSSDFYFIPSLFHPPPDAAMGTGLLSLSK